MKHFYDIEAKTLTTVGQATGTIAATLVGNVTGDVTGDLTGAASTVTVADESTDTSCFPVFVTAATGDLAPKSAAGLTFNASTDTLTATAFSGPLTGNVTGDVQGATLTTEKGTGLAGATAYATEITKVGKVITTHIFIDIEALVNSTTAGDIIGDSAAANCHLGQALAADCGQIFSGTMTCLEVPTGGDPDLDLYAALEATGTENALVTDLTETLLVAGAGSWTLGLTKTFAAWPVASSDYLYLSVGSAGGAPGTYTAGQFLIELIGYEA